MRAIYCGALTRGIAQVDEWVSVSEAEISAAIFSVVEHQHKIIEGAAAVAVAAQQKRAAAYADRVCVVVVCGGNLSVATLARVLCEHDALSAKR